SYGPAQYIKEGLYLMTDALSEAIAAARGPGPAKAGFGRTSYYREESGGFDAIGLAPFARAPFAAGSSLWYAGWNLQPAATIWPRPWDGAQIHSADYKISDQGTALNFDRTNLNAGNPH